MSKEKWQKHTIETVTVEHKSRRIRSALHNVFPKLISPPIRRGSLDIAAGDRLVFPNGKKVKLAGVVGSIEGYRTPYTKPQAGDTRESGQSDIPPESIVPS